MRQKLIWLTKSRNKVTTPIVTCLVLKVDKYIMKVDKEIAHFRVLNLDLPSP